MREGKASLVLTGVWSDDVKVLDKAVFCLGTWDTSSMVVWEELFKSSMPSLCFMRLTAWFFCWQKWMCREKANTGQKASKANCYLCCFLWLVSSAPTDSTRPLVVALSTAGTSLLASSSFLYLLLRYFRKKGKFRHPLEKWFWKVCVCVYFSLMSYGLLKFFTRI